MPRFLRTILALVILFWSTLCLVGGGFNIFVYLEGIGIDWRDYRSIKVLGEVQPDALEGLGNALQLWVLLWIIVAGPLLVVYLLDYLDELMSRIEGMDAFRFRKS